MRQHKAIARIFLYLSIVNFTFASVAQTRTMDEMRIDLVTEAEDMTEASKALPKWLGRSSTAGHLHSRFDMAAAQSFNYPDNPKENKFFSEELNRKLKEYLILGSIAGVFTGVANGIQKEVIGTVSPDAYVLPLLHPRPANT